ncbi:hypothetical protein HZA97_08000 [Candidatus Woesearchaeota archaeon]|nr:hypothetical protein [Candidatus Woesearchaeota archaeon]
MVEKERKMIKRYKLPDKPMYIEKKPDGRYYLIHIFKEKGAQKTFRKKLGRYFTEEVIMRKAKEIEEILENYRKTTKEEIRKLLESITQTK